MSEHRHVIVGARGGQGTTTVATVIAALAAGHHHTTLSATRPGDVCALTGSAAPPTWTPSTSMAITDNLTLARVEPAGGPSTRRGPRGPDFRMGPDPRDGNGTGHDDGVEVVDAGRLDELAAQASDTNTIRWLVVRGPCYLSLRQAVEHHWPADGAILLVEHGRSLSAADVADVLGVPVVAQVPVEATVARTIDAGLLLARLHQTLAWHSLRGVVQDRLGPTGPRPSPARP